MAATLGLRSLVMLVGAGYTGSFFYNNLDVDRARTLAASLLLSARKSANGDGASASAQNGTSAASTSDSAVAALARQVDRLTTEVTRRPDSSVVVLPSGAGYRGIMSTLSDVLNLLGWAVVGVSVGGAVYYVAVRKRVALRDLAWVSAGTFNGTVNALKAGLQRVNTLVTAVSDELAERMGRVESRVETVHDSLKAELTEQVGKVSQGVTELHDEVAALSSNVDHTRRQLDAVDGKIDFSNQGIALLVQAVAKMHPDLLRNDTAYALLSRAPGISSEVRMAIQAVSAGTVNGSATATAQAAAAAGAQGKAERKSSNGGLSIILGEDGRPAHETVDAKAQATAKATTKATAKATEKAGSRRSLDAWGLSLG